MEDNLLRLMTGIDVPIPDLQLTMHQPRIREIAFMSEDNFFSAMQYLCLDRRQVVQDERVLDNLSNFQILLKVLEQSKDKSKKTALVTLLSILFPDYRCIMTPQSIAFMSRENSSISITIDSNNFESLQDTAKQVLCVSNLFQGQNVIYNPVDERAKQIAEKLYEGRRKVAEANARDKKNSSILTRYVSILAIGQHLTPEQCAEYTLFQLFDQIERYNLKVEWDIDLKVRLTGTTPKSQVKNWMDDIHSE